MNLQREAESSASSLPFYLVPTRKRKRVGYTGGEGEAAAWRSGRCSPGLAELACGDHHFWHTCISEEMIYEKIFVLCF